MAKRNSRRRKAHPECDIRRRKELGNLQNLLLQACPPDKNGKASVPVLARQLGISHQYVYRWIEMDRVPPAFVPEMVRVSQGRVRLEDFHDYVFK